MKDELAQAQERIAHLESELKTTKDFAHKWRMDLLGEPEKNRKQGIEVANALESARHALRAEADRADLICYKVRDLLQARAYIEAAAYCAEKLQGR